MTEQSEVTYKVVRESKVSFFRYPLLIVEEIHNDTIHRIGFLVTSDIDGTANRQHFENGDVVPEGVRIDTIRGSADIAFQNLEKKGIPVWLISSRTYPEVAMYQQALGINGGAVIEDGTGIVLPDGLATGDLEKSYPGYHIKQHEGKNILVLAPSDSMDRLTAFYGMIESESGEELISSITNGSEEKLLKLKDQAGHSSRELAFASTVRFASSYIPKPTEKQRNLIHQKAQEHNLRVFDDGHVIHVMAGQANKATALSVLYDKPSLFFPNTYVDKVFPIACGNHTNDIQLMHQAIAHEGIGIMVAGPTPETYYVNREELPDEVILTKAVAGEGLMEAVPLIKQTIENRFSVQI